MVLPAFCDSCLSVVCLLLFWTDGNWNFSAVRSLIKLKFGGDLGLVSQISVHALDSRLVCLHFVNKQKDRVVLKAFRSFQVIAGHLE
jgi:hypothetical protein